jgi:hypothetical protein
LVIALSLLGHAKLVIHVLKIISGTTPILRRKQLLFAEQTPMRKEFFRSAQWALLGIARSPVLN